MTDIRKTTVLAMNRGFRTNHQLPRAGIREWQRRLGGEQTTEGAKGIEGKKADGTTENPHEAEDAGGQRDFGGKAGEFGDIIGDFLGGTREFRDLVGGNGDPGTGNPGNGNKGNTLFCYRHSPPVRTRVGLPRRRTRSCGFCISLVVRFHCRQKSL